MAEEFLSSVVLPEMSSRRERQTSSISSSRSSSRPLEVADKKRQRMLSSQKRPATDCYTERRVHPSQHLRLFERVRKLNEPVVGLQVLPQKIVP